MQVKTFADRVLISIVQFSKYGLSIVIIDLVSANFRVRDHDAIHNFKKKTFPELQNESQ